MYGMQKMLFGFFAAPVLAQSATAQSFQMPKPTLTDPVPEGVRVNAPGMVGNYYAASGAGKHPGVLLLGGSEGGLGPGTTRMGKALAADGFDVLHVAYFGAPDQPAKLVDVPLETFDQGLAWLRTRPEVDGERIGIVGGSKGAEAALLYASRTPLIKAVVVGMPSSVVWPGINYAETMQPSWTVGGKAVPFLPYVFGSDYRNIFGAYDNGLKALAEHPDAVIPRREHRRTGDVDRWQGRYPLAFLPDGRTDHGATQGEGVPARGPASGIRGCRARRFRRAGGEDELCLPRPSPASAAAPTATPPRGPMPGRKCWRS